MSEASNYAHVHTPISTHLVIPQESERFIFASLIIRKLSVPGFLRYYILKC